MKKKLELVVNKDTHMVDFYYLTLYLIKGDKVEELVTVVDGMDFFGNEKNGIEYVRGIIRGMLAMEMMDVSVHHEYTDKCSKVDERFQGIEDGLGY